MKPNTLSSFLFVLLTYVALSPIVQAVNPPPDGGYPGFTTAEGTKALQSLTTGSANTAVGWFSLFSNAEGSFNTATGAGALLFNTADANTAFGAAALLFNSTGINNTAVGTAALLNNTIGEENTAIGRDALLENTTGKFNTATGHGALTNNIGADGNTADGFFALHDNTTGKENTAIGQQALAVNQVDANTAIGFQALFSNTDGLSNVATGTQALFNNGTGSFNVATGIGALFSNTSGVENTAIGDSALANNSSGNNNVALGPAAGSLVTTASNVICIGANTAGENVNNSCYINRIFGELSSGGVGVFVNALGKLGTSPSARRFKEAIQPMDKASEVILTLKPVAFHYKSDASGTPQFGLIAEEVAEVNPDLVVRDKEGKPYSVRYEQVNAMLLNEFLKEHRKVENLEATVAQQQKDFEAALTDLKGQIQRVSAQLELNKSAPETVSNIH